MFRRRPVVTAYLIAAVAWVGLAVTAMAEESTMRRPIEAASLHDGPLDMVAYFQPAADGRLVVTATFVGRGAGDEPVRILLPLADGDDVAFSMPGHLEALYRFARTGGTVSVSVQEVRPWRAVADL